MAEFKLSISNPKTGKTAQIEAKDDIARPFIGLNIGEKVKGEVFGYNGYEFEITGGSDHCGFPMRKGILGVRKKITSLGGVGFRKNIKRQRTKKTVCGFKINDNIKQINMKILTEGPNGFDKDFGAGKTESKAEEAPKKEEKKAEEKPKEEKKPAEKKEEVKEKPKVEEKKPEPKKEEAKEPVKEEPKKEEKPKEEAPKEEKK